MSVVFQNVVDLAVVGEDRSISMKEYGHQMADYIKNRHGGSIGTYFLTNQGKLKLFSNDPKNSKKIGGYSWRFPFIDVQLMKVTFKDNETNEIEKITDPSGFSSYWVT